jgi:4a-hydroxytetrahydrobiopterin dehydratase
MATVLSADEMQKHLSALGEGWTIENGELTRTIQLPSFPAALLYVNLVGHLAEVAGHHPDILIKYRTVKFSIVTHDAGGLTEKDFALAVRIDEIPLYV